MIQQAANPEVSAQAEKIITDVLKGSMAERMATELAQERKLHALENNLMVIEGRKVEGGAFSSSKWQGKVVLVDFWATWCRALRARVPATPENLRDIPRQGTGDRRRLLRHRWR